MEEALKHHKEKNDNLLKLSDNYAHFRDFYNFAIQRNPKLVNEYETWIKQNEELIDRFVNTLSQEKKQKVSKIE